MVDLNHDQVLDTMLVATELVSNAYDHAKAPRHVRLHRLHERGVVRVEVDDASPSRFPVLGRPNFVGRRQRGLLLVNRLSVLWGYKTHGEYKTVWAEVPVD